MTNLLVEALQPCQVKYKASVSWNEICLPWDDSENTDIGTRSFDISME